jgi:hypothetical protein
VPRMVAQSILRANWRGADRFLVITAFAPAANSRTKRSLQRGIISMTALRFFGITGLGCCRALAAFVGRSVALLVVLVDGRK